MLPSAVLSLFIETFALSGRARVWKSNVSTKPRQDGEERKQERDYIGFGLAEQQSGRGGILDGEVEALVRISVFSCLLKPT